MIEEFGLSVIGANGSKLPFLGYIEAEISVPILGEQTHMIPVLVVSNTDYNKKKSLL